MRAYICVRVFQCVACVHGVCVQHILAQCLYVLAINLGGFFAHIQVCLLHVKIFHVQVYRKRVTMICAGKKQHENSLKNVKRSDDD